MPGKADARITVIVPTRNRGHTIEDTLKSCVDQDADCKFLISDNSSEDHTEEVVRSFDDPRITFVRTSRVLSMEASFDFALSKAEEGYLYTMGGDDALCPGGIRRLQEIIAETDALVIRPRLINYHWDNYPDPTHQQIATNVPVGQGWKWMETQPFLQAIADDLMRHAYFYEHAPAFYHGCVHSSLLSKVWPSPQPIVRSKVPDMYSGVLIGSQVPRFVLLDTPVSLNAMSCSSNGVPQFLRQGLEKGDGHSFWAEVDYPYEPELVRQSSNPDIVLAMPLLLADQFLKVKKLGHAVPEIAMDQVVTATIRGACRWHSRDQYEGAIRVARETASIHSLEDLAEKTIQAHPFKERPRNRRETTFDIPTHIYRALDLAPLGATGAHSAGVVIKEVRDIHAQQDGIRRQSGINDAATDAASLAASERDLLLWLLVRTQPHHLKGHAWLVQDACAPAVKAVLLTAPSLVTQVSAQTAPPQSFDCALIANPGADLNDVAAKANSLFVIRKAPSKSLSLEGWEVTREPLTVTTAEHVLLSINRWLKPFAGLLVWPLASRLKSRLLGKRNPTKPSGLIIEHWRRQS